MSVWGSNYSALFGWDLIEASVPTPGDDAWIWKVKGSSSVYMHRASSPRPANLTQIAQTSFHSHSLLYWCWNDQYALCICPFCPALTFLAAASCVNPSFSCVALQMPPLLPSIPAQIQLFKGLLGDPGTISVNPLTSHPALWVTYTLYIIFMFFPVRWMLLTKI